MSIRKKLKPTIAELEVLQVLWNRGASTVREVNEKLNNKKEVGYTTTLKIMQIMTGKGFVERDEKSRTHIYSALTGKDETQGVLLNNFLSNTFEGSAMNLVMKTLGDHKTSREELDQIKQLISELEKKEKDGNNS